MKKYTIGIIIGVGIMAFISSFVITTKQSEPKHETRAVWRSPDYSIEVYRANIGGTNYLISSAGGIVRE